MEKSLLLALLISGLSVTSSHQSRYYYFVNKNVTWSEAQSYCRAHYTDLATVNNMEEMQELMETVTPNLTGETWIGLNKGTPRTWGWASGETLQYINWMDGEPNGEDRDGLCGAKNANSSWIVANCTKKWEFVCQNGPWRTFIHVSEAATWRNAQAYCRQHYTDLVTIHNEKENQHLSAIVGSEHAWIGLFFDNWKWSDRQNTTFRYWRAGQPWSSTGNASCVAMVQSWNEQWNDTLCDRNLPFVCYKGSTKYLVSLKITSGGRDLNDPTMKAAILKQVEEKLSVHSVGNALVSWQVKNGKIFHAENMTIIKTDKCD